MSRNMIVRHPYLAEKRHSIRSRSSSGFLLNPKEDVPEGQNSDHIDRLWYPAVTGVNRRQDSLVRLTLQAIVSDRA